MSQSPQARIETYRDLLRNDWDEGTLERALTLLEQILEGAGMRRLYADGGDTMPDAMLSYPLPAAEWHSLWPRWSGFFEAIVDPLNLSLPDLPATLPVRRQPAEAGAALQAFHALAALLFPKLPLPGGPSGRLPAAERGLFRDTQSLIFQCSVLFLLPELSRLKLEPESALLVHALNAHALLFWQHRPSHQQFLLGILHDACGQTEASLEALRTAFALTGITEHDYLTKAQVYWSRMRDAGQDGEAEEFVLWLYRNAPQESLAEIKDLIRETFGGEAIAA